MIGCSSVTGRIQKSSLRESSRGGRRGTAFAANGLRALETETEPLCPPMLSDISKGFGTLLRIDGSAADRWL